MPRLWTNLLQLYVLYIEDNTNKYIFLHLYLKVIYKLFIVYLVSAKAFMILHLNSQYIMNYI